MHRQKAATCQSESQEQAVWNAVHAVQELLNHPFLRPTAAAQDSLVGVSKDQLKKLLFQVGLPWNTLP